LNRSQQRQQLRSLRRALPAHEYRQRAEALCRQLFRHPLFNNSRRIAVYLPVEGEVDTHSIITRAWVMGKRVYLPVLVPHRQNQLWFAPYQPDTPLVRNRFGIPEPEIVHRQRVAAYALDLVLTPLVGFDNQGNRLGMGGGFYDRTFAFLQQRQLWHKPCLVGIAYDFQQLPRLPVKPWDVPLTAVVTDSRWHVFR